MNFAGHNQASEPHGPDSAWQPHLAYITRELITLLRGHGLDHLYWSASPHCAVLSVAPGLTVWINGGCLHWTADGPTTWRVDDTTGAASHLAALAHAGQAPVSTGTA